MYGLARATLPKFPSRGNFVDELWHTDYKYRKFNAKCHNQITPIKPLDRCRASEVRRLNFCSQAFATRDSTTLMFGWKSLGR